RSRTGRRCLLVIRVSGRSRVPSPPASTTPFMLVRACGCGTWPAEADVGERREADVVAPQGRPSERAEPDQRQLHPEEAFVGVGLVLHTGLEQPAVAARDQAQRVVPFEEVRAERFAARLRRAQEIIAG